MAEILAEFTRLGRQLQSRKYHDTTADALVRVVLDPPPETKPKPLPRDTKVVIDMEYDSEHEKPEAFVNFCWRKARRLCKLFSLVPDEREEAANKEKAYRINEIKTTFNYYDKPRKQDSELEDEPDDKLKDEPDDVVIFTMRDTRKKAVEITFSIKPKKNDDADKDAVDTSPIKTVELECRDDDIYVAGSTSLDDTRLGKKWHWAGDADKTPPDDSRLVKLLWEAFDLDEKELPDAKK